MNFEEYSDKAISTAIYPHKGHNIIYPTLGLCGEAGEVAEKIKKIIRDDYGEISPEKEVEIIKELGDVLWYLNAICNELNVSLSHVATMNLQKLAVRVSNNNLHESGDNR